MESALPRVMDALSTTLSAPFPVAVDRVTAALGQEGFGVLTQIDVKKTLHAKLGIDFRPYLILGACNPALAHRALQTDLDVGVLLPCNVVVYETEAETCQVRAFDPLSIAEQRPQLKGLAAEVREKLERVIASLG